MVLQRRKTFPSDKQEEFEQKIIDLARVTRVTKGGKQLRFRVCIAIGDRKGRVGVGVAKGADVAAGIAKALSQAKKNLITISFPSGTIPYPVFQKYGAAKIMLKPAPVGTGIKAGGPMRVVLELAGVPNIVGKMLGSKNKINNVRATMAVLQKYATASRT